jgi:serine/alanine adding enzyme
MEFITKVDSVAWNELLSYAETGSPFQTEEFLNFCNSIPGFFAEVHAVVDNGMIMSLVVVTIQSEKGIKSLLTKRGIIYGGPLFKKGDAAYAVNLMAYLPKLYKSKLIYLETRNFFDYSDIKPDIINLGWEFVPYLNFQLNTKDETEARKKVSSSRMRQISKAFKNGVSWSEADNPDQVKEFYYILSDLYKNKIKKPLPSLDFFMEFFYSSIGKFLLVKYQDKVIGGIMCPIFNNKAIYEFYICGLDNEYKDQYPSVIATWAAIEYAFKNTLEYFDFMGAGKPTEDYGVRDFKARFGGELVESGRFLAIIAPLRYKTGVLGLRIKNKLGI